jgi:hypothetical protein
LDKPDRHQRPGKQGVWCGVPTHRPTCCRAGWTHISLPWWRGVGGRCGARGVRRGAVCRPAPPVCLTWVFGVTSWAAVLLSIKPVVASGEWSSPVDQDHPGELWPGSRTSVFFGLTPAAGPGCCRHTNCEGRGSLRHRDRVARRDVRETKSREPYWGGSGHSVSGCHHRQPSSA